MYEENKSNNVFKIPDTEFSAELGQNHVDYTDYLYDDDKKSEKIDVSIPGAQEEAKFNNAGNLGGANIVRHEAISTSIERLASNEIADILKYAKDLAAARYEYLEDGKVN